MPVKIEEYAKVMGLDGVEHEGKALRQNFVAVEDAGEVFFGKLVSITKAHTTILCDNEKCENEEVGDDFKTTPRRMEFDDNGDGSIDFMRKISDLVVVSNWRGEKMCFCSPECSAAYFRRINKEKIVDISSGKGPRHHF